MLRGPGKGAEDDAGKIASISKGSCMVILKGYPPKSLRQDDKVTFVDRQKENHTSLFFLFNIFFVTVKAI